MGSKETRITLGQSRRLTFDDDRRCTQSRACIIRHFARVQTGVVHACPLDLQQKCVVLECDFTVRRWMDLYVIFVPSNRDGLGTSNTALKFERIPFCFFYCLWEFFRETWWDQPLCKKVQGPYEVASRSRLLIGGFSRERSHILSSKSMLTN